MKIIRIFLILISILNFACAEQTSDLVGVWAFNDKNKMVKVEFFEDKTFLIYFMNLVNNEVKMNSSDNGTFVVLSDGRVKFTGRDKVFFGSIKGGTLIIDGSPFKKHGQAELKAIKEKVAKSDIQMLATALDLFHLDLGRYPTNEEGLNALLQAPSSAKNWQGPYLKKMPKDPSGGDYIYKSPGKHGSYDLYSMSTGIGNWQESGS